MNKIKSANLALYVTLGILVLLVGLFKMGESVNARLKATPIKTVTKATSAVVEQSKRTIYPVWVVQASARQATAEQGSVENIFGAESKPDPVAQMEAQRVSKLSRAEIFQQRFAITGYGYNGIFVGEVFFRAGEPMQTLTFADADGRTITPMLLRAADGEVTIDLGGQKLLIKDRIGVARATS